MSNYHFPNSERTKILLLTHITADNLGDQTIEISSNALVRAAIKNLGLPDDSYDILSVDASFVNKRYLQIHPNNQPQIAEALIKEADLIIFGGAPMFNYLYEGFADRTARTLDIIRKYGKPVIFSAIGIENFDEKNPTCIRLKNALNTPLVKMITTRDNFPALQKFVAGTNIRIDKVSDPAVLISHALSDIVPIRKHPSEAKKIGIFVIRGNAFKDNKIAFSADEAIKLWLDLGKELENRGYSYEYLTSGSHVDEAFIERLGVEYGVSHDKLVGNLNTPEDLACKISSYDGIVACRLHASIIAYSYRIPTVGLVWNNKVSSFYENIGYPERIIQVANISSTDIVDRLEQAMSHGVEHNEEFLMSCYRNLFDAVKGVLSPSCVNSAYSYEELCRNLYHCGASDIDEKLKCKFARVYRTFNQNLAVSQKRAAELKELRAAYSDLLERYNALDQTFSKLHSVLNQSAAVSPEKLLQEKKNQTFRIFYNIGKNARSMKDNLNSNYVASMGQVHIRPRSIELEPAKNVIKNDGSHRMHQNIFQIKGYTFNGWRLRVGIGEKRYILIQDGTLVERDSYDAAIHGPCKVFSPGEQMPVLNYYGISVVVAEGDWK